MKAFARVLFWMLMYAGLAGAAHAAERAIIVLDPSGSMWGQIDGKPKLEIARQTLRNVLQTVPADMELGLMAYGHREKGSCTDIQLVVPPAAGTAGAITAAADAMTFLGKTPLSAAVKQAAEDLKFTEDKATVILITDGLETCNADPCAVGKELEAAGIDFTAHVVGFGLTAEEGKKVACLAENTGGKYIQAGDEKQLEDALKVVVAPAPAPAPEPDPAPKSEFNFVPTTVLREGGPAPEIDVLYEVYKKASSGGAGDWVATNYHPFKGDLEPGDYIVRSTSGAARLELPVTIEAGKVAEPVFNLNAGMLVLRAYAAQGSDIEDNAQIIIDFPGEGDSSANFGKVKTVVPAGDEAIRVNLGGAVYNETIVLAAGQTVDKDLIIGSGKAIANAVYAAAGEKVDSGDLSWKIFDAKKKIDGTREQVSYAFGPDARFDLLAGDFVAVVEMQATTVEQPFSVKVGEQTEVTVALNAGVVAIEAPGGEEFRLFEAKKNLQGERNQVSYGFGETMQTTLVEGDYVVVTRFASDKPQSETPFTVKAGERTEVKVP